VDNHTLLFLPGIPYVNIDGQPILHPHGPLSMPFYTNLPLHYPSANVIPQGNFFSNLWIESVSFHLYVICLGYLAIQHT